MIEERARVVAIDGTHVWVETEQQSTCGACAANKGCGTAVLGKVLGNRSRQIEVLSRIALQLGDEVVIGIEESALLKGSFLVYVIPLGIMFLGAIFGQWLTGSEHLTVLMGILGLITGFTWLRVISARMRNDSRFQPVVVRLLQTKGVVSGEQLIRL